jgi:hypothetical protein
MTAAAIVLAAVLAVAVVVLVARPFLRDPDRTADVLAEPDAAEIERILAFEERDRALAALKELEFDHRTGKVSDADYRESIGPLREEAAAALAALDRAADAAGEQESQDGSQAASSGSVTTRRSGSPR